MRMKCIAFDCFGTVFDMSGVPHEEIAAYVAHVRKQDFTPYAFPQSWFELKSHPDSAEGIKRLRDAGFKCVTLSNGCPRLLYVISQKNGIEWDAIINLPFYRVYKPHVDAYRTVEKSVGFKPSETLMVTANPTFGDLEGSAAIGMPSKVVRHGYPNTILELAADLTTNVSGEGER